ncbi:MAG TPA: zf-HC2 domain-containing protein [Actinomycetes bacterium]|nr:zf-HC2 domain-containing protein [Actinomycetes bacterium]
MADVVEPGAGAAGAWHADGELLAAYAAGRLDVAGTWSVEAHVTSCAGCRELAGALAEPERLRRGRAAVIAAVDVPHAGVAERLLVRLGVPDYTARLLAATPALRGSWLLAVATTLAFAVLAARLGSGRDASLAFLTVAPLLPLAGIAVAYGPGIDPTYEIGLAAPMRSFKLLLLRAAAVVGAAAVLAAAASLALPGLGPGAAGWLLPALALTACSLALATLVEPLRATGISAAAWVAAVLVTVQPPGPSSVLFAVPGQAAFAILGLLAAVVVLLRRGRFESDRAFDTTPRFAARRLR